MEKPGQGPEPTDQLITDQFKHLPDWMLRSALHYIGTNYGGTLAHHLLAIALRRAEGECKK